MITRRRFSRDLSSLAVLGPVLGEIFLAQETGAELVRVHPRLRTQHAQHQRFARHFQREDCDHFLVHHGGVLCDVDGEGGLAH